MSRLVTVLVCLLLPAAALAQQPGRVGLDKRWPTDPPGLDQQKPQQQDQQQQQDDSAAPSERRKAAAKQQPGPPRVVACSGPFAKESSHIKLAEAFNAKNIAWAKVDGPEGAQLDASILFPKDAKRRLEVLWKNPAQRADTQVVVIGGQSTWTAPKGVKLGLTLPALEKINGKPFSLRGFGGENGGRVTDWNGGALAALPGGCKVGIRFAPDSKATVPSGLNGDMTLRSNEQNVLAASPKISEIIIGY